MTESYANRDLERPALGIQQPWGELILQGVKRVEVRSLNTKIRGRIYLYASKRDSRLPEAQGSLRKLKAGGHFLGRGVVIGSVELVGCREARPEDAKRACVEGERLVGQYVWELARPVRFDEPWSVAYVPYGVWFYPWRRRGE